MGNQRPLFSVIMPCYGVEQFLPSALSGVLNQTVDDLELIVVNDASPDGCERIALEAASQDPRVRVISHKANQGLSAARNTGLAAARGHYVWMCDPDDEYSPDLLARVGVATLSVAGGPDVVLFGYKERYYNEGGSALYDREIPAEPFVASRPNGFKRKLIVLEQNTLLGYAWNKCYKLDTLKTLNLRFENVRLIEDITFNAEFFAHAQSVVAIEGCPYVYRKQTGRSLTGANAYGAREYWALHQQRVVRVARLLAERDVYDDEARAVLGGLYVRYVVSALERTFHDKEGWDVPRRRRWLEGIMRSDLYAQLVPYAQARSSASLAAAIQAAQVRNSIALLAIAATAHLASVRANKVFTSARSGR